MLRRCFLAAALVSCLWPTCARCERWNDIPFGTSLAEFLTQHPDAVPVVPTPGRDAPRLPFTSYTLRDRSLGPLRSCTLEYSFTGHRKELFRIQAQCGSDSAEMLRYLTQEFGSPTKVSASQLWWRRQQVEVNFLPKAAVFTVNDVERSKSVAAALLQLLRQLPLGPPTTPSPAAKDSQP